MTAPTTNGKRRPGRDPATGRFVAGNRFAAGHGNPYADRIAAWRAAFSKQVRPADIEAAVAHLVKAARKGDRWAISELLDRTLGRPTQTTVLDAPVPIKFVGEFGRLLEEAI